MANKALKNAYRRLPVNKNAAADLAVKTKSLTGSVSVGSGLVFYEMHLN